MNSSIIHMTCLLDSVYNCKKGRKTVSNKLQHVRLACPYRLRDRSLSKTIMDKNATYLFIIWHSTEQNRAHSIQRQQTNKTSERFPWRKLQNCHDCCSQVSSYVSINHSWWTRKKCSQNFSTSQIQKQRNHFKCRKQKVGVREEKPIEPMLNFRFEVQISKLA